MVRERKKKQLRKERTSTKGERKKALAEGRERAHPR
jgi:hypothetical protein